MISSLPLIKHPLWCLGLVIILSSFHVVLAQQIVSVEYYFDTDPGIGKGTAIPVNPNNPLSLDTKVSTNGLIPGFHSLFFRVQDNKGHWSLSEKSTFFIEDTKQTEKPTTIVSAEYFFDQDPGPGEGVPLPVNAGDSILHEAEISTQGLALGFHTLHVRTRDSNGRWSLTEARSFNIDKVDSVAKPVIVAAEYYFDDEDPAYGKGIPLSIPENQDELMLDVNLDMREFTLGKHTIYLRVKDSNGSWSILEKREFEVVVPEITSITPDKGGNTGDVSVVINGQGFEATSVLKLTKEGEEDIIIADSMYNIVDGKFIEATMDLRGKDIGAYDVEVVMSNNQVLTIENGFEIVPGLDAEPYIDLIGFDVIRIGQWQNYSIVYGNRGNIDAHGVPIWLAVSADAEVKLDFTISSLKEILNYEEDYLDSIPQFYVFDSLWEGAPEMKLYGLFLPVIPSDFTGSLEFSIKKENSSPILISAWVDKPYYGLPLRGWVNPWFDLLVDEAIDLAKEYLPGVNCLNNSWNVGYQLGTFIYQKKYGNIIFGMPAIFSTALIDCAVGFAMKQKKMFSATQKLTFFLNKEVFNKFTSGPSWLDCWPPPIPPIPPKEVIPVASFDPNDKLGSRGAGSKQFISQLDPFLYQIRFENKSDATAPAQTVLIIDSLDTDVLDISTLELGFFGFGDTLINVFPGQKSFTRDVDLRPGNDLILRVEAQLDEKTGVLTWLYTSLDPATMRPTTHPLAGFLPPNVTAPEGEGGVFFTIKPRPDLPTNTAISNKTYIYFDTNEPIITPVWTNTVDQSAPNSRAEALEEAQDTTFTVSWSGNDEGSGILDYSVYYSVNEEAFKPWLIHTRDTASKFTGKVDSVYRFYTFARDSTFNKEIKTDFPDVSTAIVRVTGIDRNYANLGIKIFPNPSDNIIQIVPTIPIQQYSLKLIDMSGKVLSHTKVKGNRAYYLDVSILKPGIYIIEINQNEKIQRSKIIVNR